MVCVTDGSCHNNVQAGFTEGEREQLGTRSKFLNQRHYIIQHMLREVRHADGGVRRPPLVDQSPRVLERHNVDLVRIQSVSRHRKNLSHKTAPVLLRIVFSIAALSNHSTKLVLVVCISGRLSLSLTLPLTQISNSCGLVGPFLPLLVARGGITEFGHFCPSVFLCSIYHFTD